MKLQEWTIHYIKFRDCMKRQIKNIEEKENKIIVHEKKGDKIYYIKKDLDESDFQIKENVETTIITLNKKENVKVLIDNWTQAEENKEISFIFANPKTNEKWLIHPRTHSKISEEKHIKIGLTTMHESIRRY